MDKFTTAGGTSKATMALIAMELKDNVKLWGP